MVILDHIMHGNRAVTVGMVLGAVVLLGLGVWGG
jgi:hypothetical protein